MKHLCSLERLPFTAAYFGSMFATLYMAMIVSILNLVKFRISRLYYIVFYLILKQLSACTFRRLMYKSSGPKSWCGGLWIYQFGAPAPAKDTLLCSSLGKDTSDV